MRTTTLIPLVAAVSIQLSSFAEVTPKEHRLLIRKPFRVVTSSSTPKTPSVNPWEGEYEGWDIKGDATFRSLMVKHLKYIKKNCPDFYFKAKRDASIIGHVAGQQSYAIPAGGTIVIGQNDINFRMFGDDWIIATIVHELQHCNRSNGGEGAARWSGVVYGPRLKLHPAMVRYLKGGSMKLGYSQEKWNKLEK